MKILSLFLPTLFFMLISCAEDEVTKLKFKSTFQKSQLTYDFPKLDILFVLDNQNLKPSYQQSLMAHIEQLVGPIEGNSIVDYHIAVTTSSMSKGDVCNENGRLIGSPRYLDKRTLNLDEILGKRLNHRAQDCYPLVVSHHPFQAVTKALGQDNQGFYRRDASLAVIFVTDSKSDVGDIGLEEFKNFLINLKRGDENTIALYGAIIEKNDPFSCLDGKSVDFIPHEIEDAISYFQGLSFNLCSDLFSEELAKIGTDISQQFSEIFIPLTQIPASGTITVSYNGQVLQKTYDHGWTYDPNRKGIRLGAEVQLPQSGFSSTLEISFYPAEMGPL